MLNGYSGNRDIRCVRAAEVRFSKTEQRPVAWLRARRKKEEPRCASLHEREGMDAGIGAKATVLDCMGGAMAKARHVPARWRWGQW